MISHSAGCVYKPTTRLPGNARACVCLCVSVCVCMHVCVCARERERDTCTLNLTLNLPHPPHLPLPRSLRSPCSVLTAIQLGAQKGRGHIDDVLDHSFSRRLDHPNLSVLATRQGRVQKCPFRMREPVSKKRLPQRSAWANWGVGHVTHHRHERNVLCCEKV